MKILRFCFLLLCLMSCSSKESTKCESFSGNKLSTRPSSWAHIQHIVVVMLENKNFSTTADLPFHLLIARRGALLTQSYGITHPSQPNYIALTAGDLLGVATNNPYSLNQFHLADQVEAAGKTWKVYAQGYPGNCFLDEETGPYARKHVPFLSFINITSNQGRCARITDEIEFDQDIADDSLPDFSIFVPDNNNNGHDTSAEYTDNWLKMKFSSILSNSQIMHKTLFIFTYDESEDRAPIIQGGNHIFTAFVGAGIKASSTEHLCINHYGILSTIQDIFNLGKLGRQDSSANQPNVIWSN